MWGVVSPSGIVSIAKRGEEQARTWADYIYPGAIRLRETLVRQCEHGEWEPVTN